MNGGLIFTVLRLHLSKTISMMWARRIYLRKIKKAKEKLKSKANSTNKPHTHVLIPTPFSMQRMNRAPGVLPRSTACFFRKRVHSEEVAYWSFKMGLTFLDLWKQWWVENQILILKEEKGMLTECQHPSHAWSKQWCHSRLRLQSTCRGHSDR